MFRYSFSSERGLPEREARATLYPFLAKRVATLRPVFFPAPRKRITGEVILGCEGV